MANRPDVVSWMAIIRSSRGCRASSPASRTASTLRRAASAAGLDAFTRFQASSHALICGSVKSSIRMTMQPAGMFAMSATTCREVRMTATGASWVASTRWNSCTWLR